MTAVHKSIVISARFVLNGCMDEAKEGLSRDMMHAGNLHSRPELIKHPRVHALSPLGTLRSAGGGAINKINLHMPVLLHFHQYRDHMSVPVLDIQFRLSVLDYEPP